MNSMDPGFANRIGFLFANSWKASVIIHTNASPAMVIFTQSSNLPDFDQSYLPVKAMLLKTRCLQ